MRVVGIVASFAPRGFSIRFIEPQGISQKQYTRSLVLPSWEAWNMIRSSMRRYHTYPPHRAPMRACRYVQSSDRRSMRRELYAALRHYLIFTGSVQLKNRADIYRSYLCMLSCRLFRDLINDPRSVSWPSYSSVKWIIVLSLMIIYSCCCWSGTVNWIYRSLSWRWYW